MIYGGCGAGYLVFALPTNWSIENKGVHITIIWSTIITVIGVDCGVQKSEHSVVSTAIPTYT